MFEEEEAAVALVLLFHFLVTKVVVGVGLKMPLLWFQMPWVVVVVVEVLLLL